MNIFNSKRWLKEKKTFLSNENEGKLHFMRTEFATVAFLLDYILLLL